MLKFEFLTTLENMITQDFEISGNKEKIKSHTQLILNQIQLIDDSQIKLNPRSVFLFNHLISIYSKIDYIPTIFIKKVSDLSQFINQISVHECFETQIHYLTIDFLTNYYRVISLILRSKNVKKNKKENFENLMSQRINFKYIISLLDKEIIDPNFDILIKSVTQSEFDFFDSFSIEFKNELEKVIKSDGKKILNKYIFKLIEKCLLKLDLNVEKNLSNSLKKISSN